MELQRKKIKFLADEGAALLVEPSEQGDGGTFFVSAASVPGAPLPMPGQTGRRISPYDKDAPKIVPQIVLAKEHYNRLIRMCEAGETLKMAVELAVQFHDDDLMAYNTVAEIPGTDLKDEVVMLGGHMDSWHSGTGATDNGAGVRGRPGGDAHLEGARPEAPRHRFASRSGAARKRGSWARVLTCVSTSAGRPAT